MNFDIRYLRYRVRGRTAAEWAAINEVLLDRELGLETDTRKFKFGDGSKPWNDLEYAGGGSDVAGGLEMRVTATHIQWRADESATWNDLIALSALEGEPGDDGRPAEFRVSDGFMQWRLAGEPMWTDLIPVARLQGPEGPPGPASSAYFGATFDGGNVDIAPGAYCDIRVPYGCTITKASLLTDEIGSIVVDVRVVPFVAFPPLGSDSIVGANPPQVLGGNKWEDSVLSGWSADISSGAVVRFHVLVCTGVTRATVLLEGVRL